MLSVDRDLCVEEGDEWFVEASCIGLPPGPPPRQLRMDGELMVLVHLDAGGFSYEAVDLGEELRLTIWND